MATRRVEESDLWEGFQQTRAALTDRKEFLEGAEVMLREAAGLEPAEIDMELKELKEENARLQREFEERRELWYRNYCRKFVKKRE